MTAELRDAGAALALDHAGEVWQGLAQHFVYRYMIHAGSTGCIFEEARTFAEGCFKATPPNPNAWGALALAMSVRGFIERTGAYQHSTTPKAHARLQPLWRINPQTPGPTF